MATIRDLTMRVRPGQVIQTTLTVTNVADQVEGYTIEVCRGPARHWCEIQPRQVELLPGQQAAVAVAFRPPAEPRPPAGDFPVGLLVTSRVDPARRAVVECDVTVDAIHELRAALLTVSGRGSHRGRYRIDVANVGTAPVTVTLAAEQPGEPALSFALQPGQLTVPPGDVASGYLMVRPLRPSLFGRRESLPFWVTYAPSDPPADPAGPVTILPDGRPVVQPTPRSRPAEPAPELSGRLDGVFLRRAVIARGIVTLALVLLLLGVAAIAAARLLLPHPEPAALEQVAPPAPALDAVRQTPDGVTVSWRQVPTAASYKVERLATPTATGAAEVNEAEGGLTSLTIKTTDTGEHCYRVVAVNDVGRSTPSAVGCVTVVAGPAPTGQPVNAAYVVYGQPIPTADPDGYPKALQAVNDLTALGLQVKLLDTGSVPLPGVPSSFVTYQDGFPDQARAQQYCDGVARRVAPQIVCAAFAPAG